MTRKCGEFSWIYNPYQEKPKYRDELAKAQPPVVKAKKRKKKRKGTKK